jgi:hypothetical protein
MSRGHAKILDFGPVKVTRLLSTPSPGGSTRDARNSVPLFCVKEIIGGAMRLVLLVALLCVVSIAMQAEE